ncbi:MAG: citryl-CoA lyase [Nanoarchaeota archaeon]|nr:citryl-CoA lyase [Nanoarchaeota archaeon]MBU1976813.1 citryl-CoA lyase [Nanoarchaeota archaeon]
MEFKTRISKIENNDVTVRGEKLSNLVKKGNFSEAIFLLLSGRKASEQEAVLFEKILISVIDHGMGTTSSLTSRFVASGGNSLNTGVGAGILSIGDYHGGTIEKAMKQFYSWNEKKDEEVSLLIEDVINNKQVLYGFGHKVYKNDDPRVTVMLQEMKKIKFDSKFLKFKELVNKQFEKIKGKKIPLNIDGFIALLLCDFGFDYLLGKGIFIIGRTPGLVAQTYEELKYEKPVRRVGEEEIEYIKG